MTTQNKLGSLGQSSGSSLWMYRREVSATTPSSSSYSSSCFPICKQSGGSDWQEAVSSISVNVGMETRQCKQQLWQETPVCSLNGTSACCVCVWVCVWSAPCCRTNTTRPTCTHKTLQVSLTDHRHPDNTWHMRRVGDLLCHWLQRKHLLSLTQSTCVRQKTLTNVGT